MDEGKGPGCVVSMVPHWLFFVVASRHCVCIATMSPSRLRAARDGSARWGLIYGLTFALPSHGIDRLLRISIAGTIGGRWRLRETRVSAGTVSIISERSLLRTLIQAPGIVGGLLCVNSAGAAGRRRRLRTTRNSTSTACLVSEGSLLRTLHLTFAFCGDHVVLEGYHLLLCPFSLRFVPLLLQLLLLFRRLNFSSRAANSRSVDHPRMFLGVSRTSSDDHDCGGGSE